MKKIMKYTNILIGIVLLFCGCSEEIFTPSDLEGDNVIMSLSYSDVSPKEVVVNTRATDAEEKRLDNLYIYIFNASGQLKGFKAIEDASKLNQNTSSTNKEEINGIMTKSGASYIYAVANINTGLYPISTSDGEVVAGKLPIGLNEVDAQNGMYAFTLKDLKDLMFNRNEPGTIQISSAFLMSGAVQNGNQVTINKDGSISNGDKAIKLNRIVSKVKFTIKAAKAEKDTVRSFKLSTYDIMNISMNGKLVGKSDGNQVTAPSSDSFSNITGGVRGVNDVDLTTGTEFFEFYIPENLENSKNYVSNWNAREDDSQTTSKAFTNAPEHGTYVVLKGKYEEVVKGITRTADVTYYVHLGDCSVDVNNYDVERNCKYTYNVAVAGVDKIIVEAKKEGNEQPGAEGVIMEYGSAGKSLILDSHYDYMVMRFYQNDIKELKKDGKGYYYQVYALGKHTDAMNVGNTLTGNINATDTTWVKFAIDYKTKSIYSTASKEKGTACSYPGTNSSNLYNIEVFLKKLYDNADDNTFWTGDDTSKGRYIDATCFVDENYYADKLWSEYVNDVDKRAFYVANAVQVSKDGRSVYATTQYGLQQYNIQTFYDRSKAGNIIAYGCETINDEEGKGFTDSGGTSRSESYGSDEWDGRTNMLKDMFQFNSKTGVISTTPRNTWKQLENNKSLIKACMSRNRDLNGDGIISKDEVRWYAPAIHQYIGLWIGEEIISTESKLYNKSTDILNVVGSSQEPAAGTRMLYYTSTQGTNTFFSEEGLATANHSSKYPATYVRCIRNLQSNAEGYDQTPSKYYSYNDETKLVQLDKVDTKALNITGEQGELNAHTERSEGNKPASAFYIAPENYGSFTQKQVVEGTGKCNGNYTKNDRTWRVPNQRELSMMFLLGTDIKGTYCRTKFSNEKFRHSWTYDNGIFTMDVNKWNSNGSIRCISVKK